MYESLLKSTFLIFLFCKVNGTDTESLCGFNNWVVYEDEKCFKLINELSTRDEAEKICKLESLRSDSLLPTLASIKSTAEQEFLNEYLFNSSQIVDSVWIGAQRSMENNSVFIWNDSSDFHFTNWAEGSPSDEDQRDCVQIQSKFAYDLTNTSQFDKSYMIGQWNNVPCNKKNLILCQKLQAWTFPQLQKTFLDARSRLKSSLEDVTKKLEISQNSLYNVSKQLEITTNILDNITEKLRITQNSLDATRNQLNNSLKNPVPIGFIYVQLPNKQAPSDIWPGLVWLNVTPKYAGYFFRAEGGSATPFESGSQKDAFQGHYHSSIGPYYGNGGSGGSQTFWEFRTSEDKGGPVTDGKNGSPRTAAETRPINYSVRIWERTK